MGLSGALRNGEPVACLTSQSVGAWIDGVEPSFLTFLLCRNNEGVCALPLDKVGETMRLLPLDPFPGMPAHVLGVSIIRGFPVPVVDAARLFGAGRTAPPGRVVTLRVANRFVGLAVDDVIGVRAIPVALLHDVPGLLDAADASVVSAIAAADESLLVVLREARLVSNEVWVAIDQERAQ